MEKSTDTVQRAKEATHALRNARAACGPRVSPRDLSIRAKARFHLTLCPTFQTACQTVMNSSLRSLLAACSLSSPEKSTAPARLPCVGGVPARAADMAAEEAAQHEA